MKKAVASKLGVPRAIQIWTKLKVLDRTFPEKKAWTEKELTAKTWQGIDDPEDFRKDPHKWRYFNNLVMDEIERRSRAYVIDRFFDKATPTSKRETKICKPDRLRVMNKLTRNVNQGAGNVGNAISLNDLSNSGQNILADFAEAFSDKLDRLGMPLEEIGKHMQQLFISAAKKNAYISQLQGTTIKEIKYEFANDVLSVLDSKPKIEAKDIEMDEISHGRDGLANSAKQRRKENARK